MQHSYDGHDRPGGFSRVNLLAPLRHRDFALLWTGQTASLIGDGVFLVAMAWQVYAIWDAPAALAMVGIAMTVPTIVCLLPGGVVSDRLSRRGVTPSARLSATTSQRVSRSLSPASHRPSSDRGLSAVSSLRRRASFCAGGGKVASVGLGGAASVTTGGGGGSAVWRVRNQAAAPI